MLGVAALLPPLDDEVWAALASRLLVAGATADLETLCPDDHFGAGPTPLLDAVRKGHAATARVLRAHGANACALTQSGHPAFSGWIDAVYDRLPSAAPAAIALADDLIDRGADVMAEIPEQHGATALCLGLEVIRKRYGGDGAHNKRGGRRKR